MDKTLNVARIAKKALKILGDTEHSHHWDCEVDEHAFIASNVVELLNKAKTENDLKKVLKKIEKGDSFDCKADWHSESMSEISDLIAEALEPDQEEEVVIDPTIKHYVGRGSVANPKAQLCKATVKGKSRKCCRFCIKISKNIIIHAHCCEGKPHGHFSGLSIDNSRGPTKLSEAKFIDNRDGYGKQHPILSVVTAEYLVKKLKLSETV